MKKMSNWKQMAIIFIFLVCCMNVQLSTSAATAEDYLQVIDVEIVPLNNVIHKEAIDTYIFGSNSELEMKMTFAEKIVSVDSPTELDLLYSNHRIIKAVFDRLEGDATAVFRIQIEPGANTGTLNISRKTWFNRGQFTVMRTVKDPASGTPVPVEKKLWYLDFNRVSRMPKMIFRNDAPTMKLTPTPEDVKRGDIFYGFTGEYLIVDINDKLLDPWDFRINYQVAGDEYIGALSGWQTAKDRNLIFIPEELRGKYIHLFVHIEDVLGNSWAWTYHYGERDKPPAYGKVTMSRSLTHSAFFDGIASPDVLEDAKAMFHHEYFFDYLDGAHRNYDPIVVFLHQDGSIRGYSHNADDIDIENSGFQWSPFKEGIDFSRPIQPFERWEKSTQYTGSFNGLKEGYWGVIGVEDDGIDEDGRYYLHVAVKDAVSGALVVQPVVHYLPSGSGYGVPTASFVRDRTQPTFSFDVNDATPQLLELVVEDPLAGVAEVHMGISTTTGDTVEVWTGGGDTSWYHLYPNKQGSLPVEVQKVNGEDKKIRITINVANLPSAVPWLENWPVDEPFYLHFRARDHLVPVINTAYFREDQVSYTSRQVTVGGLVPPGAPPAAVITYSEEGPTNQPVTATIELPEGYRVINNGGNNTYTFRENGMFPFKVLSRDGHEFDITAQVFNIDTEPPVITLDGPRTYSLYQGLAFEFVDPGYSAVDNEDGDVTDKVIVDASKINVYRGGYYEVVYTVTDSAGNTAREVRGVSVYDNDGISLLVNGELVRNGQFLNAGTIRFEVVGLQTEAYQMRYLPGKHRLGAFKEGGIPIVGKQVTLPPGWVTFFVQDENRTTALVQVELR